MFEIVHQASFLMPTYRRLAEHETRQARAFLRNAQLRFEWCTPEYSIPQDLPKFHVDEEYHRWISPWQANLDTIYNSDMISKPSPVSHIYKIEGYLQTPGRALQQENLHKNIEDHLLAFNKQATKAFLQSVIYLRGASSLSVFQNLKQDD